MTQARGVGAAAVGCFGVGAAVLLIAGPTLLRLAGALLLIAAMFLGVAAIATPELLGRDEDTEGDAGASPL